MVYLLWHLLYINTRLKDSVLYKFENGSGDKCNPCADHINYTSISWAIWIAQR